MVRRPSSRSLWRVGKFHRCCTWNTPQKGEIIQEDLMHSFQHAVEKGDFDEKNRIILHDGSIATIKKKRMTISN